MMESIRDLRLFTRVDWVGAQGNPITGFNEPPHAFMSRYDHDWQQQDLEWRHIDQCRLYGLASGPRFVL